MVRKIPGRIKADVPAIGRNDVIKNSIVPPSDLPVTKLPPRRIYYPDRRRGAIPDEIVRDNYLTAGIYKDPITLGASPDNVMVHHIGSERRLDVDAARSLHDRNVGARVSYYILADTRVRVRASGGGRTRTNTIR